MDTGYSPLDIGGGGGLGVTNSKVRGISKRLVRLAPNLVHMCKLIWEWIYAKQIAPSDTRGHLGVLGCQTFKGQGKLSNGWTNWHQLWFTSADSSGNGHRLNTSRPSIPQGACRGGGGLGGHKFKSLWKLSKGWTDWHQIWYTSVDSSGNGLRLKQFAPRYLRAAFWVVLWDQQFKRLGNVVKRLDRLGINFAHIMQMNLVMDTG